MGTLKSSSPFFHDGPPAEVGNANPEVLKFLESRVEGEILDLGGGMGAYAHALRQKGYRVTLAEKDPRCLQEGQKLGIPVLDMNTVTLEELRERFDTVLLVEVLEHVSDYRGFLKAAAACGRKKILLTVPCNDDFERLFEAGLTYNHVAVTDHLHQFTSKDISALFEEVGYSPKIHTGCHLFPHPILALLFQFMWGSLKGKLALSPLKFFLDRGWLPNLFPSRIFVEAALRK